MAFACPRVRSDQKSSISRGQSGSCTAMYGLVSEVTQCHFCHHTHLLPPDSRGQITDPPPDEQQNGKQKLSRSILQMGKYRPREMKGLPLWQNQHVTQDCSDLCLFPCESHEGQGGRGASVWPCSASVSVPRLEQRAVPCSQQHRLEKVDTDRFLSFTTSFHKGSEAAKTNG